MQVEQTVNFPGKYEQNTGLKLTGGIDSSYQVFELDCRLENFILTKHLVKRIVHIIETLVRYV